MRLFLILFLGMVTLLPVRASAAGHGSVTACWQVDQSTGWLNRCSTPTTNSGTCDSTATGTSNGTCWVAVANAGTDSGCKSYTTQAAAIAAPCQHLGIASTMIRSHSADHMILKKGDTWTVPDYGDVANLDWFGNAQGTWCAQGKSTLEPIVIEGYGTGARPLYQVSAITTGNGTTVFHSNALCPWSNVAVTDLDIYNYRSDPNNGSFSSTAQANGLSAFFMDGGSLTSGAQSGWLENVRMRYAGMAVNLLQNVYLIRNIVWYQYSTIGMCGCISEGGGSYNIYAEGNFLYHNGWSEETGGYPRDTFSHNTYFQVSFAIPQKTAWLNNISFFGSDTGLRDRQGGYFNNNLLWGNSTGIEWGNGNTPRTGNSDIIGNSPGLNAVTSNVIMDNEVIPPATAPDGSGIQILAIQQTAAVTGNLAAHIHAGVTAGVGISLNPDSAGITATGNVICDFFGTALTNAGSGNTVSGNTAQASCSGLPGGGAGTRTPATYDSAVLGGPGTIADLSTQMLGQSKDTWNQALTAPAINSWIRPDYGLAP